MVKIYSKIQPEKVLHIFRKRSQLSNQTVMRQDLCQTEEFLQVASLKMSKGQTFKPHQHIWREGEREIIPQESWIVIEGVVQVFYYDLDGKLLDSQTLMNGDISITFEGGHNYLIHAENTLVYEMKSARYYGQEKDKKFL